MRRVCDPQLQHTYAHMPSRHQWIWGGTMFTHTHFNNHLNHSNQWIWGGLVTDSQQCVSVEINGYEAGLRTTYTNDCSFHSTPVDPNGIWHPRVILSFYTCRSKWYVTPIGDVLPRHLSVQTRCNRSLEQNLATANPQMQTFNPTQATVPNMIDSNHAAAKPLCKPFAGHANKRNAGTHKSPPLKEGWVVGTLNPKAFAQGGWGGNTCDA
jgi:hypothetical protein